MSVMDVCFSVLILSGAFAIMALGLVFLRSSALIHSLNVIVATLPETTDRVNKILEDINYKLDLLNAPLETINRLFNRAPVKHGDFVAKTAASIIKSRKDKKK